MRKIVSAILVIFVFLSLQFGKIATYLYCKWQAEVVQQQADCGCETHLSGMFEHYDFGHGLAKISIKEKPEDYFNHPILQKPVPVVPFITICFAEYDSPLMKSFIAPVFHPPAV